MSLRDEANQRHLEMHEAKWQEYLWDAQIREYRSSQRMDMTAVYKWCDSAKDLENKGWCIAPLHKSSYMLITNRQDLVGLNNKGGLVK